MYTMNKMQGTELETILKKFGLTKFYTEKITVNNVIYESIKLKKSDTLADIPWTYLSQILMANPDSRDIGIGRKYSSCTEREIKVPMLVTTCDEKNSSVVVETENASDSYDPLTSIMCKLHNFKEHDDEDTQGFVSNMSEAACPLDIVFATFLCCNPLLRRLIITKMSLCRLALPFIYRTPAPKSKTITCLAWPFRSLLSEHIDDHKMKYEAALVDQPNKIVTCLRFGHLSISKSETINRILSDKTQNTFYHRNCPMGLSKRNLFNDAVEISWYFPTGRENDVFNETVAFLNIRGDVLKNQKYMQEVMGVSNLVIAFIDTGVLQNEGEIHNIMKTIHAKNIPVVFAVDATSHSSNELSEIISRYIKEVNLVGNLLKVIRMKTKKNNKSQADVLQELRRNINNFLTSTEAGTSMTKCISLFRRFGMECDEDTSPCQEINYQTDDILKQIEKQTKTKILQLQDPFWTEISLKQKEYNRAGTNTQYKDKDKIEKEMRRLREQQIQVLSKNAPVLDIIIDNLITMVELNQNDRICYFVQYLQQKLDNYSRKVLPELEWEYQSKWKKWKNASENKEKPEKVEKLQFSADMSELKLSKSAFGIEHIVREFGQMYEAYGEINNTSILSNADPSIQKLPEVVAQLIFQGFAFEIMDGDASNIPISWISAVFSSLEKLTKNKKVLTISILGIQSSGKSTLLNCMFGLEFPVKAGRCTRGVFMRLLTAPKEDYPFDHILVVDTEGLRAPGFGMHKYYHDNELATFVIGIGDITLINIKGENTSEVQDVLQIAVHAFMKLVMVNSRVQHQQSCIFVHQNVSVTETKRNLVHATQKTVETLDKMTKEAAEQLNIANIQTFKQVIRFESQNDIWYFPSLWYGDPPMASTNPGYSKSVAELRYDLLTKAANRGGHLTISETSQRIQDLWKGILSEDFVFNFRNTLEIKAYIIVETKFQELTSKLRTTMFNYIQKEVKGKLAECQKTEELDITCNKCISEFRNDIESELEKKRNELGSFFDNDSQHDILIKWKNLTLNKLESVTETYVSNACKDIEKKKEICRLDLIASNTLANAQKEINQRAKKLAQGMRGIGMNEKDLKCQFQAMIEEWKENLIPPSDENEISLNDQVDATMFQRLTTLGSYLKEIQINKLMSYDSIGSLSTSINTEHIHEKHISMSSFMENGYLIKKDFKSCAKKTLEVTENIFLKLDVAIAKKINLDEKFNCVFITELLNIIVTEIDKFNCNKKKSFYILDTYKALLAVHVCNYAKNIFSRMNERYESKHGWKAKFEEHEKVAWNIFQRSFHERAKEYISATLLKGNLVQASIKHISAVMTEDVKTFIRGEIGSTKHALMTVILDSLANEDSFESIRVYIQSSKDFAQKWLFDFAKSALFETRSVNENAYLQIAKQHIQKIMKIVSESITFASEKTINNNVHTWLDYFTSNMSLSLPSMVSGLRNVYAEPRPKGNLEDFIDFVKAETTAMDQLIFAEFKSKTATNISWCNGNPVEELFVELWGCDQHCPFCHEPCQFTMKDHLSFTPHKCLQHRPPALVDVYDEETKELVLEVCNFSINDGKKTFNCITCEKECRNSVYCKAKGEDEDVFHSYREYKKYIPNWDIAPDSTLRCSDYWSWVIATFKDKINKIDNEFKLPEIPEAWTRLTIKQAKDSLRS